MKSANSTKTTDGVTDASQSTSDSPGTQLRRLLSTSAASPSPAVGNVVQKRPVGRPPEPVPAHHADSLIQWLSEGKPLREWCRQPGNPEWRTVYHWMDKDEEFTARIARAREDGYDVIADQCMALADDEPRDQVYVAWRRLQVDTRLKLLAKWNPKKYGDRQAVAHEGGVTLHVITGVPDAN